MLLHEAVEALVGEPSGLYVDGTFGRGGHSRLILSQLDAEGRLLATDKDPDALAFGATLAADDARFRIAHNSFADFDRALEASGWAEPVDGLLLDLGVSSPQLDEAERGFSFSKDGPLDMRMDSSAGMTAAEWLAEVEEAELRRVLRDYGEEKFAGRIARAIVERCAERPLQRTSELAELVSSVSPSRERHKHPATRVFQAIRIAVNEELSDLERCLDKVIGALKPGGRLVVISFHSLEDRIVKRFMRDEARGEQGPRHLPLPPDARPPRLKLIGKARKASAAEVDENVRARSAVLRIAERLED